MESDNLRVTGHTCVALKSLGMQGMHEADKTGKTWSQLEMSSLNAATFGMYCLHHKIWKMLLMPISEYFAVM